MSHNRGSFSRRSPVRHTSADAVFPDTFTSSPGAPQSDSFPHVEATPLLRNPFARRTLRPRSTPPWTVRAGRRSAALRVAPTYGQRGCPRCGSVAPECRCGSIRPERAVGLRRDARPASPGSSWKCADFAARRWWEGSPLRVWSARLGMLPCAVRSHRSGSNAAGWFRTRSSAKAPGMKRSPNLARQPALRW